MLKLDHGIIITTIIKIKMINITKNNIEFIRNISKDKPSVLLYSEKSTDENLDYAKLIARIEIIKGNYTYTPRLHSEYLNVEVDNYVYYIDKGIDIDLLDRLKMAKITFKTLSRDNNVIEMADKINKGDVSIHEACQWMAKNAPQGMLKGRGDYTNYLFDNYLDHERVTKVEAANDGSDVDKCFDTSKANRLSSFKLREASLFSEIVISAEQFSGVELYEIKRHLKGIFDTDKIIFKCRTKIKSDLLNRDFSISDVIGIKGKIEKKDMPKELSM